MPEGYCAGLEGVLQIRFPGQLASGLGSEETAQATRQVGSEFSPVHLTCLDLSYTTCNLRNQALPCAMLP